MKSLCHKILLNISCKHDTWTNKTSKYLSSYRAQFCTVGILQDHLAAFIVVSFKYDSLLGLQIQPLPMLSLQLL
jgi:hypothetical protein